MKNEELAYLAGIIDGEGWITIDRCNNEIRVGVAMVDTSAVELLQQTFGGKLRLCSVVKSTHRRTTEWEVSVRKAKDVLTQVLPYLRIKRRQAEVALEFQETKKYRGSAPTPQDVLAKRSSLVKEMVQLNHRGASA